MWRQERIQRNDDILGTTRIPKQSSDPRPDGPVRCFGQSYDQGTVCLLNDVHGENPQREVDSHRSVSLESIKGRTVDEIVKNDASGLRPTNFKT